jgi:tRNA(Arg) A34 adenosine deaminase TadA
MPNLPADDQRWIRHSLMLADRAEREHDEIPVGAVLVDADGQVLGEGWNRNVSDHDPSAHAEIVAMRQAGQRLGNHRLSGCTLYVTLEPCAMCAMAAVHARVARLVFAAYDPKTGAAGSVFDLLADPRHNHRIEVRGGVLGEEAGRRLTDYFRRKRGKATSDPMTGMPGQGAGRRTVFDVTARVIRDWDCHGLLAGGAPADEFDSEIAALARQVARIASPADAAHAVARVFVAAFGDAGIDAAACGPVGKRWFDALLAEGLIAGD